MTTTENDTTRRVRVTHEPVEGSPPWRAVVLEDHLDTTLGTVQREIPVGRFETQPEAVTTGVSALRFLNAGIPWRPTGGRP